MALRPARLDDLQALLPLVRDFCSEDDHPFEEGPARAAFEGLLRDDRHGRAFVIEDEGALAGYLVVTFGYSIEFRGRDAFVDELYVVPARRGRGLGREALRVAEDCCRQAGASAVHLEVGRDNARAQELYREWGFRDRTSYLMSKELR
jgi:ribosomal protein S18 acetylase RimI-like enzyme